jgi:cell division protein FtsQ
MLYVQTFKDRAPKDVGIASARVFGAGAALLMALLALVGAALGLDALLRADNFPVAHVYFEGPFEHVTRQQLVDTVKVHGNFFALDLDAIKARVESLPWVYRASVRRHWPRDLYIRFSEQHLIAHWGEHDWLNESGELVQGLPAVAGQRGVPRLDGPPGTEAQVLASYGDYSRTLLAVGLQPTAVTLTSRRTWELQLNNGIALVLARDHPQVRLERFARVYRQALAPYAGNIKQVDLRYANGFTVAWVSPPAGPLQAQFSRGH